MAPDNGRLSSASTGRRRDGVTLARRDGRCRRPRRQQAGAGGLLAMALTAERCITFLFVGELVRARAKARGLAGWPGAKRRPAGGACAIRVGPAARRGAPRLRGALM
jgi:hypothetical protein